MSKVSDSPMVLVADMDPQTSESVQRQVSEAGFPVLIAADGPSAARALVLHRPPIVILGKMPEADRPALRDAIEAARANCLSHVIMITAHAPRSRLITAWEVGVDEFLSKPFTTHELFARLRTAVRALDLGMEINRNARQGLFHWRRSRVQDRLCDMARTDELTGLANLRYGLERLDEIWQLARRHQHDLSLAIVDVDDFKRLNETCGPDVGDAVLQQVGAALGRSVRDTDMACRVGGQEFLLIFPDERSGEILPALDRCRRSVEACIHPTPDAQVTISAGIAERWTAMQDVADLIRAADAALFEAKAAGKNQIAVAPPPSDITPLAPAKAGRENAA